MRLVWSLQTEEARLTHTVLIFFPISSRDSPAERQEAAQSQRLISNYGAKQQGQSKLALWVKAGGREAEDRAQL